MKMKEIIDRILQKLERGRNISGRNEGKYEKEKR
jgi:hypothetical protein